MDAALCSIFLRTGTKLGENHEISNQAKQKIVFLGQDAL
jgi:hypothetical protein